MSPVTLAELDPKSRAKALQQIEATEGTTTLATVVNETFTTLGDPAQMTTDALVTVVIDGVQKIRSLLPYIAALKSRFDDGQRDSANRLVNPINGCHSWRDFCVTHLDRAPQTIGRAFAPAKQPLVKPAPEPTDQPIAEYKSLIDAVPAVHTGGVEIPPSQYGVAEIEESVAAFAARLVSQLKSASDKKIAYASLIRKFQDLLGEL